MSGGYEGSWEVLKEVGCYEEGLVATDAAFHAYQSRVTCAGDNQVIVYDTATINQGGGYNAADGIFDAPSAGLYLFSWTTASQDDDWIVTELIVNGARKGLIGTDTANTDMTP
ncbi:uncharacterized protein LOC127857322 [Dreissena polymorpha]|uniref:uncharacterized protein LOC127857322 n=1 Tax=Dreissena polymorpha TaxID=45954 RepID=UPI00226531E1|nr:uncharacterized protein LOC127857322 [Dreissena polymorpha]